MTSLCFSFFKKVKVSPQIFFLPHRFLLAHHWPELGHMASTREAGKGSTELGTLPSSNSWVSVIRGEARHGYWKA